MNASTIKRIAAVALLGPDPNTDVGHAFRRRYGTREMLTYLATMSPKTPIEFTQTTVGLYFPNPRKDPWKAVAETLKSPPEKQSFLIRYANQMAFVTKRVVGKTPFRDVKLFLPSWVIGVNQVVCAKPPDVKNEIDTIISEQGWVVGLVAMAARGMEKKDILRHLQQFEIDFDKRMPKLGWFTDGSGENQLSRLIANLPKHKGFRLDFVTLSEIERIIDLLYQKLPKNFLPDSDPREIRRDAPIIVKKGELVFVLPSEHEYLIREAIAGGKTKEEIHKSPKSEIGKNKFIDRLLTVYPIIQEVDFYPFYPFMISDREPSH